MHGGRLFEMIYLLMEKRNVTAKELAQRFEVSERTVYRDIDALSAAGIPVYAARGKGGGIRLMPDFVLNKSLLTKAEQDEILFALQSLTITNALEDEAVLQRLRGLFQRAPVDWIDVDFTQWGAQSGEKDKFNQLKQAILQNKVVAFTYYSSYGLKSRRRVEPMKLRFKGAAWYLQAYCLQKRDFRTFKVSRIAELTAEEEGFNRRELPLPELEPAAACMARPVKLTLRFEERSAFRVYDEFAAQDIVKNPDGSFTVEITFPEGGWMLGYLLSFGDEVTVLSPQDVRRRLLEEAKKIAVLYEKKDNLT